MKFIDLFEKDIETLKVGKPTKIKYEKIKKFTKEKEFAKELDILNVKFWYVYQFLEDNQYHISWLERQITIGQKLELLKKSLYEKVETRYEGLKFLRELKENTYDVGDYIRKYRESTITEDEKIVIKTEREKRKKELEEEIKESRRKHGDPFKEFREKFGLKTNNYEVLGLEKTASKEEIKKAYRKLCKIHHPDVGGNIEKFRGINQAYEILIAKYK